MTLRPRRRARRGVRGCFVAAAWCVATAATVLGQTSREASSAELEQLVQQGAVRELETALGSSTAPADLAALARAQANHAAQLSEPGARHAAFEDAAKRYERWIAALGQATGRAPAVPALEVAEARAELGAMVLTRWASRDLAEFELTGGRGVETARLVVLLQRAEAHYRAALAATDQLMQPLRAARPGVEEDYLALGIFDALSQTDLDARFNVAWVALYRAIVSPGANAERLVRLSESEARFRELLQRSLPPRAAARTRVGLGIALREMQRWEEAVATLTQSVQESAGSDLEAQARCELARVHLRTGWHAEARAVLRPVVETAQPAGSAGYADLAHLLHAESLLVEADTLERQAQDSPARGALLRKAERSRDEGLAALARIAERGGPWPGVVQSYVQQHARFDTDPGALSPGVLLLTAQALRVRGDVPGARQRLDAALARGEVPPAMRASLLLERARCEQAAGDTRAAASTLLAVWRDYGEDPRAQEALGDACRLLAAAAEESKRPDDYRQAADALWQLTQRFPRQGVIPDAAWWCAVAYQNSGDDASAARAFAAVPAGSGNWEAAQFQRLAALRRLAARDAATLTADELSPRMRSIAEGLETYAAEALRRAGETDGAAPTRRYAALARLEAARLWLDPLLNDPERAARLLSGFDDPGSLPEAKGEVLALRVRAAAAQGRFGDALALMDHAQAAGGDALRDAVSSHLAQAIQREIERLESAEAGDALRKLATESLPFFESLRAAAAGSGAKAPSGIASRPAPDAAGVSRTLAKLYHHAGHSEAASRLIGELLRQDPRDGELLRLNALDLTAIAERDGGAGAIESARRAWEPILADASLIERSPRTYWEARCHHLSLLLRAGQASVVRDAIRQERAWRPELGGEPWRSTLASLLEKAEAQAGAEPVRSAPASRP